LSQKAFTNIATLLRALHLPLLSLYHHFNPNNNFIVRPHHHHSHLKYIIMMPCVKKVGQGALGEDLAIKGKEKAITSFFQVKPKPLEETRLAMVSVPERDFLV
jgi:hypothetical protein